MPTQRWYYSFNTDFTDLQIYSIIKDFDWEEWLFKKKKILVAN